MDKLESELRRALRREEPPPDFSARVMAEIRAAELTPRRARRKETRGGLLELLRVPTFSRLKWAAAALTACLLVAAFAFHRRQVHRERGELARQQAMLALEIASTKLNLAFKQVNKLEDDNSAGARTRPAGRREKL